MVLKTTNSEACQLNLAHAFWLNKDTAKAISSYEFGFLNAEKKSIALSQLGVITFEKTGITSMRELKEDEKKIIKNALTFFKAALKRNVKNEEARYNYELLKYLLAQKTPEENKENQDKKDDKQEDSKDKNDQKEDSKQDQNSENQQDKTNNSGKESNQKEGKEKEGDANNQDQKEEMKKNDSDKKQKISDDKKAENY